jgi:hypothetical protein
MPRDKSVAEVKAELQRVLASELGPSLIAPKAPPTALYKSTPPQSRRQNRFARISFGGAWKCCRDCLRISPLI